MKIKYKALWIEDQFEYVEQYIAGISDRLKDYGFKLEITRLNSLSGEELEALSNKLSNYNPYDMILFDYDLGENNKAGNEIARELRNRIFTDMIFYSGKSSEDLRTVLYDTKVDGVYPVYRPNFLDDAWPIIEDQIKRICDINNMRGVILDEMSKIDLKIRDLYKEKYEALPKDTQEDQVGRIQDALAKRIENIEQQKISMNSDTLPGLIKKPLKVEFNTVRMRLNSILNNDQIFGEKGSLKQKQDLRNQFAHNGAVYDDDEGTVSIHGYDTEYSFDDFTNIRKELIGLLKTIDSI